MSASILKLPISTDVKVRMRFPLTNNRGKIYSAISLVDMLFVRASIFQD